MGGRVAAQACQVMKEVSACLNQDGGLFGVDFHSGEVIPFVTEHALTNGSLLNIDVVGYPYRLWRRSGKVSFRMPVIRSQSVMPDPECKKVRGTYKSPVQLGKVTYPESSAP